MNLLHFSSAISWYIDGAMEVKVQAKVKGYPLEPRNKEKRKVTAITKRKALNVCSTKTPNI